MLILTTVLAFCAATWSLVRALAPLLQLRRMLRRRSSADVSVGYLVLLLLGFCLWVGYGNVSGDIALAIPNAAAATHRKRRRPKRNSKLTISVEQSSKCGG